MTKVNKKSRIKRLLVGIVIAVTILLSIGLGKPVSFVNVNHLNINFTPKVYVIRTINESQK
ncbi:hypothetical protein IMAU30034_01876 [Lactobacillus helveticus]|nr:hypothetical protein [Lactobacillus helveticus]